MNIYFYRMVLKRVRRIPVALSLLIAGLQLMLSVQVPAVHADENIPKFYRGLLNGYYVELVVDWLPDKSVEGEIWTAAHKVTPRELGFDFAKVKGDNQLSGHLELEIVGDEVSEKNNAGNAKAIGIASLKKTLTGDYIEWSGEYRRTTGETLPMVMYRERRPLSDREKPVTEKDGQERSPHANELSGAGTCEDSVCGPVWIDVCVQKKSISEAREYFQWLKFPVEVLCASSSESGCARESICTGETWVLEVDGFSEPYWERELENLPFITSARRSGGTAGHDTGIIEMPLASFFSDTVPDHEEAVKKISEFFNEYFSEAIPTGNVKMTMKERTRFNYIIDILGDSPSLSLRKPGVWEHYQLRIMMSQPYPYDYPEKFAVYVGLSAAQYSEWTENEEPPSDSFVTIKDDGPSVFLERMVSAFAHKYRAAVWTP
jgi:hypothetical protein